jgi:hypothetical protein
MKVYVTREFRGNLATLSGSTTLVFPVAAVPLFTKPTHTNNSNSWQFLPLRVLPLFAAMAGFRKVLELS